MSEQTSKDHSGHHPAQGRTGAFPLAAFRGRRAAMFAAGGFAALVLFAYFDGGEEPIRPIVQQIADPATGLAGK